MPYDEERHEYGAGTYAPGGIVDWRRVSWGAIFAGTFVALVTFMMIQLFVTGIATATTNLTGPHASSVTVWSAGMAIWSFIISLVALFIGGWVAGRLGRLPSSGNRALHGLTVWAFFYLVMFFLVTTMLGAFAGSGLPMLGRTVAPTGPAATSGTAPQEEISLEAIRAQITGAGATQQGQQDLSTLASAINNYFQGPQAAQERRQLVQTIAQATTMTEAQADQMITNLGQQTQPVAQTGEQVASVTGVTLFWVSIVMFIGAWAAMLGGAAASGPGGTYPYGREHAPEAKAEHETYAAR